MTDFTVGDRVEYIPLKRTGHVSHVESGFVYMREELNPNSHLKAEAAFFRPAPVEIPGDTECAACGVMHKGGPRMGSLGMQWDGVTRSNGGGDIKAGAPVCDDCARVPEMSLWPLIRSRGGWPRKQAEVEMYGTQPSPGELPPTLPAGTKWAGDHFYQPGEFTSAATLRGDSYVGEGFTRQDKSLGTRHVFARLFDWAQVPRPPNPASGSTGHQAPNKEGCGPSPADPVAPERPKLDASGFLDRDALDEQTAKRIPERDAARLSGARPSKHHQALAALDVKSGRPRYAETSRVFSTATWEEDS